MFDYNKKKYRFLKPVRRNADSILDRPEFMYPDPKNGKREPEERTGIQPVNYLKKPRSEIGGTAVLSSGTALILSWLAFRLMVKTLGNPPLSVSAIVVSAMLLSFYGMICAVLSLREKDKDHLPGIIGLSIGGLVLVTWIITIFTGLTA